MSKQPASVQRAGLSPQEEVLTISWRLTVGLPFSCIVLGGGGGGGGGRSQEANPLK